jgi:CRISPR-associated protein Csm1
VEAISDPRNLNARLRGSISVSHLGVASLLRARTAKSVSAAWQLIDQWQEPDRSDLLWFLQSESLLTENLRESPPLQVTPVLNSFTNPPVQQVPIMTSSQVALQVAQQAVSVLAKWAGADLLNGCQCSEEHLAVTRAKAILSWSESISPNWLRLLFDAVKLPDGKGQDKKHYYPAKAIANYDPLIPYPQSEPPTSVDQEDLKKQIREALTGLDLSDWQNLSLLTLILEKFGSCLSFGEPDVALIDMARATGAIAAALAGHPDASELSLVAGDLSGIQKFIYTISSDGALKSLRARSFYLELVTEEVVQQLLVALDLPRTSIIYAGGGNLYLLAAATHETREKVQQVQQKFNTWLKDNLQRKVYLALDCLSFKLDYVASQSFATHWNQVIQELNKQKLCKFSEQINSLLAVRESFGERCRVCHRDDTTDLDQLNRQDDSVQACPTCRKMFQLGSQLFKAKVFLRSYRDNVPDYLERLTFQSAHYYLFEEKAQIQEIQDDETLFLLNNWTLDDYRFHNSVPLLLGNYGKESDEEKSNFIRAIEMANKAEGIKRVGYLRMDVDNLGKIFAKGLNENHTLPRLAGLSRQMSYFFKVYLNSLAENRQNNFLQYGVKFKYLSENSRTNLLFIYAGGDDLFVSGAWNEVVEFAFDIYQSFRAYTGHNPDITLSGGVSIATVKYPLYQAAQESGEAEKAAKGNGRDSLGLFGEKFRWNEWLGEADVSVVESREQDYWEKVEVKPGIQQLLLGVFPFVHKIKLQRLSPSYSRSFVRNLLNTAQLQDRMIRGIKDKRKHQQYDYQVQDIQYYLHLPQIAYTLARLPREKLNDEKFRKSLKSPYNAPYFRAIATWIELLTRSSNL